MTIKRHGFLISIIFVAGILFLGYAGFVSLNAQDSRSLESGKQSQKIEVGEWESILSKATWDLLEKKVSGVLAKKLENVDLNRYRIFSVKVLEGWTSGDYTGGKVDVVMMNQDTRTYDWFTFNLLVKGDQVVDADIEIPNYFSDMVSSNEKLPGLPEFISSVFNKMNPSQFGYRYRSQIQMPDMKWNVTDQKVIGRADDIFLVEVKYSVHMGQKDKNMRAILIIRKYEGKKFQVEQIKVLDA